MIINRGNLVASDTLENIRRDNSPQNRIHLTVRANAKAIEDILKTVVQVLSYEIVPNEDEPNLYDVFVEVLEGVDIREKLFFAFADKRYAVRRLAKVELSLEEIFLMLTDAGYADNKEDEDDDSNGEYDEEEEEDEDDGDYKPLFGAGRREEDDE